jgi:hypothetical protein
MAKSIKQLQDEILAFLDTLGQERDLFTEVKDLDGLEKAIGLIVGEFIKQVQENLEKAGKIDTGALSTDITQSEWDGSSISVGYPADSQAAKYYDYVNKGVKGFLDESKAPNSPYQYQSEYPKFGGVLHKALMQWYRRNASYGRMETQRKGLSAVQRKRKKLSKMVDKERKLRSLAYATAINIKRKGLKTTGYFDKAVEKYFGNDLNRLIAKVVGREIQVNIKKDGNNNR